MGKVNKVIEIEVAGAVGSGKSEVLQVIKNALVAHYGPHTQVASYDLSSEPGDVLATAKRTGQCCRQSDTVFILSETNSGAFDRRPQKR